MTQRPDQLIKPLAGIRVVELAGLGPVPYAGQLLADLGAEVIAVARHGQSSYHVEDRGKRSLQLDLKTDGAVEVILSLLETADILTEGYRPGVAERLGLGPDVCLQRKPSLVYARMTGWGQHGPWSQMAGHDINYIGLTGVLHAIGEAAHTPPPPLNLIGDYAAGSLFLCTGVLAALHRARTTGQGDVLDIAMVDGAVSLFGFMLSQHARGEWTTQRQSNMLDGALPYYRCYRCSDDRFVAVGALEDKFFQCMLDGLSITSAAFGDRHDVALHPQQHQILASAFATRPRDEWAAHFEGTDACVTPVLDFTEAARHPHLQARNTYIPCNNSFHPNLAPRFQSAPVYNKQSLPPTPERGQDSVAILQELGISSDEISTLLSDTSDTR